METITQTNSNSHPNFAIAQDGVTIWSSDPEEQKAIDEAWDKISQDTFNTLSPEEQQEIKEIEKVINEGWELKDRLSDPEMQRMCIVTCKLAADYKFAKIYQHTSDGQEMLDRFKANCYTGGHYRQWHLMTKQLDSIYGVLSKLSHNSHETKCNYQRSEEEDALLEFMSKVNAWAEES